MGNYWFSMLQIWLLLFLRVSLTIFIHIDSILEPNWREKNLRNVQERRYPYLSDILTIVSLITVEVHPSNMYWECTLSP